MSIIFLIEYDYDVVVSMFAFQHIEWGSNPGQGGKFHNKYYTKVPSVNPTRRQMGTS